MDDKNQKNPKKANPVVPLSASQDSVLDASLEPTMVEPLDPLVGKSIGRYQILAHVAKGGTGTVYRALDTVLSREVALKILHEHLESKREVVERFKKEAMLIAQLRHPNILTVYDFLDFNGRAVLVVEYMPGFTLSALIKDTPKVPEDFVFMITLEILQGLKAAHEKGITHRDIKPANILLHPELGVKISDFGLAKITAFDDGLTKEGIFVGTPSFSSPEQIEGKALDHRSDIFSLGLTLYILATRSHAFKQKGDSTTTVWFKIVKGRFNAVRNMDPTLSPDLDRILDRALQVPVEARYQSAQEMINDVEGVLKSRGLIPYANQLKDFLRAPTKAYQSTFVYRAPRTKLKFRIFLLLILGLSGTSLYYILQNPPILEKSASQIPAQSAPDLRIPVETLEEEPAPTEFEPLKEVEIKVPPAHKVQPKPPPKKVVKDIPLPEAISLPSKAEVVVYQPKMNPGLRFKWNEKADFALAKDTQFKTIISRSPEATTFKEIKSIAPGNYFWRAGKALGSLRVTTMDSYREQKNTAKRPVTVLSSFEDVDLEINPYVQELRLDWTAGPKANSYKLEVASDEQFKLLLFSGALVQKSQNLPRAWDRSQIVFWRVTYLDDRGDVFLIDPIRRINLKVQGHSSHYEVLSPKPNESLKAGDFTVRLAAPASAKVRCGLSNEGSGVEDWKSLQRGDIQLRAKLELMVQSKFIVCEFIPSSGNSTFFLVPIRVTAL